MTRKSSANEVQFELKYCERCGGLWLRPVGSGQIYCVSCGREIAKMPPASDKRKGGAMVPRGPSWGAGDGDIEGYEEDECDDSNLDAAGGVA
jgi:hypothetical protein